MKAVLWSRKAVLAAVIEEPIILEIDAGEDPIPPMFEMLRPVGISQFCACAPVASRVTAKAIPIAEPVRRPRPFFR